MQRSEPSGEPMQRIERYGVVALVFLLVTILAVSLWGEHKGESLFSFLKRKPKSPPAPSQAPLGEMAALGAETATGTGLEGHLLPLSLPQSVSLDPAAAPPGLPQEQGAPSLAPLGDPGPSLSVGNSAPPELLASPILPPATVPSIGPPAEPARLARGPVHVVAHGETLGEIAGARLGTWKRWTEIQALNGNLDPARVRPGMELVLPADAGPLAQERRAPSSTKKAVASGGTSTTVRAGDTLSKIAARQLGDGERWREIVALNPGLEPKALRVGQVIQLPESSAARSRSAPRSEAFALAAAPKGAKKGRVR